MRFLSMIFLLIISVCHLSQAFPAKDVAKDLHISSTQNDILKSLHKECIKNQDSMACMKFQVLSMLDGMLREDTVLVTESIKIVRNSQTPALNASEPKSNSTEEHLMDKVQSYALSHDVIIDLPMSLFGKSSVILSPRNLDNDEIDVRFKFDQSPKEEGRKSKLRKILVPILVFVLLKAMTLIPLFIGALGLKAWNALQLSFFSFVISVAMAIFQLCKKLAADASVPTVTTHGGWEAYGREMQSAPIESIAQELAYNAYK